jgi:predicted nucleic acid-binding protein
LIVLDASAAVELFVARSRGGTSVAGAIRNERPRVPSHFDAEVFAAIRGMTLRQEIVIDDALAALYRLRTLRVQRVAIVPLVGEAFALRDRFAAYDAFYAIVARLSSAALVTCDRGLARAAKGYCQVEYVALG